VKWAPVAADGSLDIPGDYASKHAKLVNPHGRWYTALVQVMVAASTGAGMDFLAFKFVGLDKESGKWRILDDPADKTSPVAKDCYAWRSPPACPRRKSATR